MAMTLAPIVPIVRHPAPPRDVTASANRDRALWRAIGPSSRGRLASGSCICVAAGAQPRRGRERVASRLHRACAGRRRRPAPTNEHRSKPRRRSLTATSSPSPNQGRLRNASSACRVSSPFRPPGALPPRPGRRASRLTGSGGRAPDAGHVRHRALARGRSRRPERDVWRLAGARRLRAPARNHRDQDDRAQPRMGQRSKRHASRSRHRGSLTFHHPARDPSRHAERRSWRTITNRC